MYKEKEDSASTSIKHLIAYHLIGVRAWVRSRVRSLPRWRDVINRSIDAIVDEITAIQDTLGHEAKAFFRSLNTELLPVFILPGCARMFVTMAISIT